jgi:hypothetical protein
VVRQTFCELFVFLISFANISFKIHLPISATKKSSKQYTVAPKTFLNTYQNSASFIIIFHLFDINNEILMAYQMQTFLPNKKAWQLNSSKP